MIDNSKQPGLPGAASKTRSAANLNWLVALLVVAAVMAFSPSPARGQDDEYLRILDLVEQADASNTNGPTGPALAKYQEAQTALRSFQRAYPDWNAKVVSYRLNYLAAKLAAFSQANGSAPAQPASSGPQGASAPQLKLLEPGAEPRQVLRLHPKPGGKQTLTLTTKMAMDTKLAETQSQAVKLPGMKISLDLTVKTVSGNGDIAYEMVITDASV